MSLGFENLRAGGLGTGTEGNQGSKGYRNPKEPQTMDLGPTDEGPHATREKRDHMTRDHWRQETIQEHSPRRSRDLFCKPVPCSKAESTRSNFPFTPPFRVVFTKWSAIGFPNA